MAAGILPVADAARVTGVAGPITTVPVRSNPPPLGSGGEKLAAGRPCTLQINRDRDGTSGALDGTLVVWGVNLPHIDGRSTKCQKFIATAAQVNFEPLLANMPYVAWANFNWVVTVNGTILDQGAGAGKFTVTNPATTQARIVLGTASAAGDIVEVYFTVPEQLLASGAHPFARVGITGKTLYWCVNTHAANNFSKTLVQVVADPATV
jgi:hypothetical protein